jgi:Leucine-rich repeat (LRR) protein
MSNRFTAAFLLVGLVCLAAPTAAQKTPGKSPFPDKALETAVRAELHEPTADLTDQKLNASLFFLRADKKGIRDLTGLKKGQPLAEIKLSHNEIVDLKPLQELTNLQSLDLAGNKIVDVTPLGGLTKLQYLELSNN